MFNLDSSLLSAFGILSFGLGLLAYGPYIRNTLARRTKPQRSSWLIWAAVSSIALASQIAEGASHSLWFVTANWLVTIVILTFSVWSGTGSFVEDRVPLALATGALLLWCATNTPAYALGLAILTNSLGASLTVIKAYRSPETETLLTWITGGVSAILGLVSVGSLDPILIAYPLYLVLLYFSVSVAIWLGRLTDIRASRVLDGL